MTQWCRDVGVVAPFVVDSLREGFGWSDWPFTLLVAGRPLRHLVYVPLLAGPTVSGYFLARAQGPFTAQELGRLADLQGILVASHAPFLRAAHAQGLLTPRQRQVLHLLHRGLTAHSIAGRLQISASTVGKHLRDLYGRFDAHDRVSAVREAQLRGLLDGLTAEPGRTPTFPDPDAARSVDQAATLATPGGRKRRPSTRSA